MSACHRSAHSESPAPPLQVGPWSRTLGTTLLLGFGAVQVGCGRFGYELLALTQNEDDGTAESGSVTNTAEPDDGSLVSSPDVFSEADGAVKSLTSDQTGGSAVTAASMSAASSAISNDRSVESSSLGGLGTNPSSTMTGGDGGDSGAGAGDPSTTTSTTMDAVTSQAWDSTSNPQSSGSSAPPSSGGCVGLNSFAPPQRLTGLPVPSYSPTLSADGLTLLLASGGEIYSATRATVDSLDFAEVTAVAPVNTVDTELTPSLSFDGLRLYFARGTDPMREIYVAARNTTSDSFGSPSLVGAISTPGFSEILPRERFDGLEIFFTSVRSPSLFDVYVARRTVVTNPFDTPALVTELNTDLDESPGGLSSDGLTLTIASKRTGSLGGQDVWTATRQNLDSPFTAIANEAGINSSFNEIDPTLSADDRELLFASDRSGQVELYRSVRCVP